MMVKRRSHTWPLLSPVLIVVHLALRRIQSNVQNEKFCVTCQTVCIASTL